MPSRPSKRTKKDAAAAGPSTLVPTPVAAPPPPGPVGSRLFAPFRALGLVSDAVPFSMFVHAPKGALAKPTIHLVTSVGRSWLMWDADRITLLFASPDAGAPIASLAQTGTEVFAAAGSRVIKYVRGKETARFDAAGAALGKVLLFGDEVLALKADSTGLLTWNKDSGELANEITFHGSFTATEIVHPATYLNKVLVGSREGELQLWNIRTGSLIHTFPPPSSGAAVTALVQAPALDVVGVGHLDGSVRVLDIRTGELVMSVKMDEGSVTGVAFRMDGEPVLATASSTGAIALWDLAKGGRVLHINRTAHEQAVSGLEWVAGQPLLVSSSGDNSVKQWVFDAPAAAPRLLKFRSGHHAPPTCIRYYGTDGKQLLTAGQDRSLRYTSVVRDSRSHELSQGSLIKKAIGLGVSVDDLKLPPITALSSSSARSKDWDDVLTAHAGSAAAHTWRVQDKRLGAHAPALADGGSARAVCVSACGNFALAGSSAGDVRMWNMQSGRERKSYGTAGPRRGDSRPGIVERARPKKKERDAAAQAGAAVTGIATDALNTTVVVGTLDGNLYFFDFHTTERLHVLALDTPITAIDLQRDSNLLAVVCDDLAVRLVDIETRRVVRELRGFRGRVLDTAFSPDARWLLAAALDGVVRTYDIPTGRLVDAFRVPSVATSLAFSPTGDFLATAHVGSVGVHLWANRAQFSDVTLSHVKEDDDVPEIALPSVQGVDDDSLEGLEPVGAPEYTDVYTTPEQLADGLLTLSLMPRSRWQTLLNLDTIRARNKPKEPPKAPEAAPFFLPTVAGLEPRFDLSAVTAADGSASHRLPALAGALESDFTRRLAAAAAAPDPDAVSAFWEHAKSLSPSALDLELRSLTTLDHLAALLAAVGARLAQRRDFEAVQAVLRVALDAHADVLVANPELRAALDSVRAALRAEGERLRALVGYALGTLAFVRAA